MEPGKDPTPVKIIEAEKAIPVVIENENKEGNLISKDSQQIKAPETTEEEDRVTLGQRKVNLIWERTQAIIALIVVITAMFSAAWVVVVDRVIKVIPADSSLASAWTIIATAIGLVVGFYFSRTNHSAIGGTGKKEQSNNAGTR